MSELKGIFRLLIVSPVIFFSSCIGTYKIIDPLPRDQSDAVVPAMIIGIIAVIAYLVYAYTSDTKKLSKKLQAKGIKADYHADWLGNAIAIDRANSKVFVNTDVTPDRVLKFDEIEQVLTRDQNNRSKLIIRLDDFDTPEIAITLAESDRDEAFEKLRVACGLS